MLSPEPRSQGACLSDVDGLAGTVPGIDSRPGGNVGGANHRGDPLGRGVERRPARAAVSLVVHPWPARSFVSSTASFTVADVSNRSRSAVCLAEPNTPPVATVCPGLMGGPRWSRKCGTSQSSFGAPGTCGYGESTIS